MSLSFLDVQLQDAKTRYISVHCKVFSSNFKSECRNIGSQYGPPVPVKWPHVHSIAEDIITLSLGDNIRASRPDGSQWSYFASCHVFEISIRILHCGRPDPVPKMFLATYCRL